MASSTAPETPDASSTAPLDRSSAPHDSSDAEDARALLVLARARSLLVAGLAERPLPPTFARPLANDCPLKPLSKPGYHGFADIRVRSWRNALGAEGMDHRRVATEFDVQSVHLQLRNETGALLPVELLLATFIHELAHTVTQPEMRRAREVGSSVLKLQPGSEGSSAEQFIHVHHTEDFYTNFAELLRTAEQLGIFALPSLPNKFAQKSLMRFDSIDRSACAAALNLGRSVVFGTASPRTPLRIIATDSARVKTKPVILLLRTAEELLGEARRRLNLRKKPTTITDASGTKVGDAELQAMRDGTMLVVA